MSRMRIIDAHTHIFPDKIAGRARDAIGEFYDLPMNSKDASVRTLLEDEALIGAEYMLCCSAALDPNRVESINNLLHDNADYIIGRMGIPYKKKGISIISIALDAPQDIISSLAGKIGNLEGVNVKTSLSNK